MFYKNCSWLNRIWSIFSLPVVCLYVVSADRSMAQTKLSLDDWQSPEKAVSSQKTNDGEPSRLGTTHAPSASLTPSNNEPDMQARAIDVQFLPREASSFATTTEALQGIENTLNQEHIWQYPAIDLQTLPSDLLEVAAAEDLRGTERESFTIDDYIPEPDVTPLVTISSDVATIPDDQVEWRATLWGGLMTDNDLESTLIGQGIRFEDSNFLGLGVSRTLAGGNTIKVEGELQLLHHVGKQDHIEGTAALALRWIISPSFSIALIEGVSYATALPEIEDENFPWASSHFLNYLALEMEYVYTQDWAIAGRLHHRSGVAGLYGNTSGASNAYLFGLRHRF